ncbi:hypothetical protein J15TS10_13210 [Paenibacillus woosongensis]|uniref:Uncharacterized protein n=1 Tax=Paenibacillus woosongensis TaxID=307580 RepID=A0ABQ4MP79_9BACL|nr:hypothetical protein J15TS10_13210 [Paenibacillus woosongensis]
MALDEIYSYSRKRVNPATGAVAGMVRVMAAGSIMKDLLMIEPYRKMKMYRLEKTKPTIT